MMVTCLLQICIAKEWHCYGYMVTFLLQICIAKEWHCYGYMFITDLYR